MNRPVRIALTLFVSATILIFLVLQRLEKAQQAQKLHSHGANEIAQSEQQMVYIGLGMVGLMLLAGIVLVVKAMIQARREKAEAAAEAAASDEDG